MTGAANPRIHSVLETCLYASDLAPAAQFYEETLGLRPIGSVADRHVFFRCGPGVFLLFNPDRTSEPGGELPPHGCDGGGHVAFGIRAEELPGWRSRLEARGISIERQIRWPSGGESLYVRDPAGNSVELTTPSIWDISEVEAFGRT
jgi:catechol 2,3-dioxygenase-like lactoylglutathione lyase family enzyme